MLHSMFKLFQLFFEGLAQHVLQIPNIVPNVWPLVPNVSNITLKFGQHVHMFETILF